MRSQNQAHTSQPNQSDLYLRGLLTQSHFDALTSATEKRVIGGLIAYVLQTFQQEYSEIYIYDLAVGKAYRRLGLATVLIQRLRHIAIACQAWIIIAQVDPLDEQHETI